MNVALVNPFDPVPGEGIRDGRYAAFCNALVRSGHRVTWLSSDWSHILKRRRDTGDLRKECRSRGFEIVFASPRPYSRNVSVARWRNHADLAAAVPALLEGISPRPEVILVSTPPPNLAASVGRWAHQKGIPFAVDVQDLWPETYQRLWPRGLGWLNRIACLAISRDARTAYRLSSGGLAVAEPYARHYLAHGGAGKACHTLHLGVDLAEFDRSVMSRDALHSRVGVRLDKRLVFAGGSMGSGLHWDYLLDVASLLGARGRHDIEILVAGTGAAEEWVRCQIAKRKVRNLSLLGQQPYSVFCSLAAASDFGFNHYRADSFVFLPNRVFDYFAADLLLINTIPGELADLITFRRIGFTTPEFDVNSTVQYIESQLGRRLSPAGRPHPRDRRGEWVGAFDRPIIAAALPGILTGIGRVSAWREHAEGLA